MSESCSTAIWLWIGSLGLVVLWFLWSVVYSAGRSMGRMEERRAARADGSECARED